jgi:hypothetical protein
VFSIIESRAIYQKHQAIGRLPDKPTITPIRSHQYVRQFPPVRALQARAETMQKLEELSEIRRYDIITFPSGPQTRTIFEMTLTYLLELWFI